MLLPFDVAGYAKALAAAAAKTPAEQPPSADGFMQAGFHASNFFLAGPAGYDAAFSLNADDIPALDISYSKPIYVLFSGFAWSTTSAARRCPKASRSRNWKPTSPASAAPARILCPLQLHSASASPMWRRSTASTVRQRRYLSCRQADRVAQRFLRALKLVGGAPQPARPQRPRGRRSTGRSRSRPNSPITARAISFPAPAPTDAASAASTTPSMRACASRSGARPTSPIRNPSTAGAIATSPGATRSVSQEGRAL